MLPLVICSSNLTSDPSGALASTCEPRTFVINAVWSIRASSITPQAAADLSARHGADDTGIATAISVPERPSHGSTGLSAVNLHQLSVDADGTAGIVKTGLLRARHGLQFS